MADASLWITIVTLLAVFDFTKAQDDSGEDITVEAKFGEGIIRSSAIIYNTHASCMLMNRPVILCHLNVLLRLAAI